MLAETVLAAMAPAMSMCMAGERRALANRSLCAIVWSLGLRSQAAPMTSDAHNGSAAAGGAGGDRGRDRGSSGVAEDTLKELVLVHPTWP